MTCPKCGTPNAYGLRFCGQCGNPLYAQPQAAAVAAGPAGAQPGAAYVYPYAYPVATPSQMALGVPRRGHLLLWVVLVGGVSLFVVLLVVIALLLQPVAPATRCNPICPHPPPSKPALRNPHTYTSTALGYSLDYFDNDALSAWGKITTQDDHTLGWTVTVPQGKHITAGSYPIKFTGEPARGRTAKQVADELQQSQFANARAAYTIPGAELGYNEGYGNVYDLDVASGSGQTFHGRLVVMVVVKKGLAVELVSIGPYQRSTQDDGHPNPADTYVVEFFGNIANTVRFPGDQPL